MDDVWDVWDRQFAGRPSRWDLVGLPVEHASQIATADGLTVRVLRPPAAPGTFRVGDDVRHDRINLLVVDGPVSRAGIF